MKDKKIKEAGQALATAQPHMAHSFVKVIPKQGQASPPSDGSSSGRTTPASVSSSSSGSSNSQESINALQGLSTPNLLSKDNLPTQGSLRSGSVGDNLQGSQSVTNGKESSDKQTIQKKNKKQSTNKPLPSINAIKEEYKKHCFCSLFYLNNRNTLFGKNANVADTINVLEKRASKRDDKGASAETLRKFGL